MTWSKLSRQFGMVLPVFVVLWFVCGVPQVEDWTGLTLLQEFAFAGFAVIALYFQLQLVRLLFRKLFTKRERAGGVTE